MCLHTVSGASLFTCQLLLFYAISTPTSLLHSAVLKDFCVFPVESYPLKEKDVLLLMSF